MKVKKTYTKSIGGGKKRVYACNSGSKLPARATEEEGGGGKKVRLH